jgi:hypothetical protein
MSVLSSGFNQLVPHTGVDSGGPAANDAQQKVVTLITSVPTKMTKEYFFGKISPQLLQVYISALSSGEHVVAKVTALIVAKICDECPEIGVDLISQISRPLLAIHGTDELGSGEQLESMVLVNEKQIELSVEILSHILSSIALEPPLLKSIMLSKCGRTILALFVFILDRFKACSYAKTIEEMCFKYLENLDPTIAAREILCILFNETLPFPENFIGEMYSSELFCKGKIRS